MSMLPLRRVVVLLTVAALGVAGCAPSPVPEPPIAGRADVPRPDNVQDPGEVPSPPATPPPACDPRASLRPPDPMPRPGAMPAGSSMAEIQRRGRLIVGIDQNAYLMGFRDPVKGTLTGFEVDFGHELAEAILGDRDKVQFRAITTAARIPVLENGEVDVVIRTFTSTCERAQRVAFSTEYLTTGQRMLVNRGSGLDDFADLAGKKVCATRGSTSIVTISRLPAKPTPVTTDSTLDCLVLLQQGQVDAVSTIDVLLYALAAQDPGTEVVGDRITDEPAGIGVSKQRPDLVRFVNGVLERMRADGTWTDIYAKWLSRFGPVPAPPPAKYQD